MALEVIRPGADRAREVASVLAEAFADYPVMRYVLGGDGDYGKRLETLVTFFTLARVHRDETLLGVEVDGRLRAAALVSDPRRESPPSLESVREETWAELGEEARERYEAFGAATAGFDPEAPHIHLNMIGVLQSGRGLGLGRSLLEHVHAMSLADPESEGVSLTTEDPGNLPLYEHFGYEIIGHARVSPKLETWGFFRRD
jgi:GNAT superfamily N-acetyltransferase